MNNKQYPDDKDFQMELNEFMELAPLHRPSTLSEFRKNINQLVWHTCAGTRSLSGFIKIATALKEVEKYKIDVSQLFIASLKTHDINEEFDCEDKSFVQVILTQRMNNLISMVKGLLEAKVINKRLCITHLSSQLLFDCQIIQSKTIFDRNILRMSNAYAYNQNKYRFFCEATEGYAYVLNTLTTMSTQNEADKDDKLQGTSLSKIPDCLNVIQKSIDLYNLDRIRVLFIVLELFIKQITVNYEFWTEIIRASDCWIQNYYQAITILGMGGKSTGVILSKLIGFILFNHRENCDVAPQELYLTIAILLKNNIILLGDVLPYLSPSPEYMGKIRKEYDSKMNEEIKSNSGGKLAMYGALGEEGNTEKLSCSETTTEQESTEQKKKTYQGNDVVGLLKALFAIGDLKNAHLMLSEYEKAVELYPKLVHDIYRLCRIILQPAYDKFVLPGTKALHRDFADLAYQSRWKKAQTTEANLNPPLLKKGERVKLKEVIVVDALLDGKEDLDKRERYCFFYREDNNQIELCKAPEYIQTKLMPIWRLAGYKSYLETDLVGNLVAIAAGLIHSGAEHSGGRDACKIIIREFLLPAISFSEGNPGTMADVWDILRKFSFQERYEIYDEWYNDFYKDDIETKLLKARTERAVKYVMRRVSKNDIRRCARDLGKLAHSNPAIVFNVVLEQVQNFDNMAPLMADAFRYLGDFAYDVLGHVLTGKWTGSINKMMSKPKEKEDGMPSNWLRSLAVFTGMLYKKQDIDCTPLLRYLAERLGHDDSIADLILLNEFVTKMGGIEILDSACTDNQIAAAGCADSLKTEAFLPITPDNCRASPKVLNRLKESLRRNGIGFEILILLYRLEEVCDGKLGVPASDRCTKLDKVHKTRDQYFELLCSLFEGKEYADLIPNVDVLVSDYRLPLEIAMIFNRPKIQYKIAHSLKEPIVKGEIWTPFKESTELVLQLIPDPPTPSIFTSEFYTVFWQLSLYDIHCPVEHYQAATNRHTEMIRQCQDPRSSYRQANSESVVRKSQRRAIISLATVRIDFIKHRAHVKKVLAVLQDSCTRWFPNSMTNRVNLIHNILRFCIFPRSRHSEVDAVFCFEFAILMHKMNTRNFSSLTLFDKLLTEYIPPTLVTLTEYEATVQSRFVCKILSNMATWRKDKEYYYKQAHGKDLIGFQENWDPQPTDKVSKENLLNYDGFLRVLLKWHNRIYADIKQAITSDEAHVIKNAFLVLRQFLPCFPATIEHGESIAAIVKKISDEENDRPNLKVLTRSYHGLIAKSSTKWVTKFEFMGLKDPAPPKPPLKIKIPSTTSASTPKSFTANGHENYLSERRDDRDRRVDRYKRSSYDRDRCNDRDKRSSYDRDKRSDERKKDDSTRRKTDLTRHTSSARHVNPSRTSETRSQLSDSTNKRKRSHETDSDSREGESSRIVKSLRIDERQRTPSSSTRSLPRDSSKEPVSKTHTLLYREPLSRREPVINAVRNAVRDLQRTSNSSGRFASQTSQTSFRSSSIRNPTSSGGIKSSRIETTSSRHGDNYRSAPENRGTKRSADDDVRDRIDHPNKKRDIRSIDRTRDERPSSIKDCLRTENRTTRIEDHPTRIKDRLTRSVDRSTRIDGRSTRVDHRLRVGNHRNSNSNDRTRDNSRRMNDRKMDNRRERDSRDCRI